MVRRGLVAQSRRRSAGDRLRTWCWSTAPSPTSRRGSSTQPMRWCYKAHGRASSAAVATSSTPHSRPSASTSRACGCSTPVHRRVDSPTACCNAAPPTWWRSTSVTGNCIRRSATTNGSRCLERFHVRDLDPIAIGGAVDLVVADLSFISIIRALPPLIGCVPSAWRTGAAGQATVRSGQGRGRSRQRRDTRPGRFINACATRFPRR